MSLGEFQENLHMGEGLPLIGMLPGGRRAAFALVRRSL
jgi:hypothetical protein